MPKRRNVMLGLGALAFGSGAITTMGAFSGDVSSQEADFRVIADAQLRVRSARGDDDSPIVSEKNIPGNFSALDSGDINITDDAYSNTYGEFETDNLDPLISNIGSPSALGLEINQGVNDGLRIRLGLSNRLDEEIAPLLEVSNNTATAYKVRFNFAENDGSGNISGLDGYGANVLTSGSDPTADDPSNNKVSRQLVQTIFQFRLDTENYGTTRNDAGDLSDTSGQSGDDALLSPDPSTTTGNPDQADDPVHLSGGENIFVKLDVDTSAASNVPGKINSAAAGGGTPWSTNSLVDLLDNVYVQAETI